MVEENSAALFLRRVSVAASFRQWLSRTEHSAKTNEKEHTHTQVSQDPSPSTEGTTITNHKHDYACQHKQEKEQTGNCRGRVTSHSP